MSRQYECYENYQGMLSSTFEIHIYKARNTVQEHMTGDYFELYCVYDGEARVEIGDCEYDISRGDILLMPPRTLWSVKMLSKSYEWISLLMNPWYLSRLSSHKTNLTNCFVSAEQNHCLFSAEPFMRNRIVSVLTELLSESRGQEFGKDILMEADVRRLLIIVNRYINLNIQKEKAAIENVISYINGHYTESITLDFLCDKFYISKFYLSRSYERVTGKSIYQSILEKRMIMARKLVICGEQQTDFFALCGFNQYSNFYRAFKKYYRMSPSAFIKNEIYPQWTKGHTVGEEPGK